MNITVRAINLPPGTLRWEVMFTPNKRDVFYARGLPGDQVSVNVPSQVYYGGIAWQLDTVLATWDWAERVDLAGGYYEFDFATGELIGEFVVPPPPDEELPPDEEFPPDEELPPAERKPVWPWVVGGVGLLAIIGIVASKRER